MHHPKGGEEFLDIMHTIVDSLGRLSNRRVQTSNLQLNMW